VPVISPWRGSHSRHKSTQGGKEELRILVATGRFSEDSPEHKGLANYHGSKIHLPSARSLWPNPIRLAWYRKHKFQRT